MVIVTNVTTKSYQGYYWTPKIAKSGPKQYNTLFFCPKGKKSLGRRPKPFFFNPFPRHDDFYPSFCFCVIMCVTLRPPPPNYTTGLTGELWSNRPLTILTTQCCIHANSMRPCRFLASMQIPCVHTNSVRPCKFRENLEYKADSVTESMNDKLYLEHPRLRRVC